MSVTFFVGVEEEPRIQFTITVEAEGKIPQLITLPDKSLIGYTGSYAGGGLRYSRITSTMTFSGMVHDWPLYTKLKG
jgi:hypothetical protein